MDLDAKLAEGTRLYTFMRTLERQPRGWDEWYDQVLRHLRGLPREHAHRTHALPDAGAVPDRADPAGGNAGAVDRVATTADHSTHQGQIASSAPSDNGWDSSYWDDWGWNDWTDADGTSYEWDD